MKLGHLFLLLALGLAIPPNYREECAFLQSAGLENTIDIFHGEEIELGMMDKLTRAAWPETGLGDKTEEWPCSFTFNCLNVDDCMNTR